MNKVFPIICDSNVLLEKQFLSTPYKPCHLVSVIIPYYENQEKLDLTMKALIQQTYPKNLIEIIIVDDGSIPKLSDFNMSDNVRIIYQENNGFRASKAKDIGARAASGDILMFLDSDMILSSDSIMTHAFYHHKASNLCIILYNIRYLENIENAEIESLIQKKSDFKNLYTDLINYKNISLRLNLDLTCVNDDIWMFFPGPNFSLRKDSYFEIGGFLNSLTNWGLEDTHFFYRAYMRGLILMPISEICALHIGIPKKQKHSLNSVIMQQNIAHKAFRSENSKQIFIVPKYIINIKSSSKKILLSSILNLFDGRIQDFIIRIDLDNYMHSDVLYIKNKFKSDPRIKFGNYSSSLIDFPDSAFHIDVCIDVSLRASFINQLLRMLKNDNGMLAVYENCTIYIIKSWLLHRIKKYAGYSKFINTLKKVSASKLITNKTRFTITENEHFMNDTINERLKKNIILFKDSFFKNNSIKIKIIASKYFLRKLWKILSK